MEEDYPNLVCVIRNLKHTINLMLVLGSNRSGKVTWNMDTLYTHNPTYVLTPGRMYIGIWEFCFLVVETKDYNNKGFIEIKLVGADDKMTFALWMK